ncbi:hypothetical protein ACTRXD_17145 [Nitrospira sp. T9]|uniref:hypothetical protein n=1 Tax=unclassified Nitrospira TaxID=2652172 RepID=UPI003F94AAAE
MVSDDIFRLYLSPTAIYTVRSVLLTFTIIDGGAQRRPLHAHDRTRNDSLFIKIFAFEYRVRWNLDIRDPLHFNLAEQGNHVGEALFEVRWETFGPQYGEQLVCQDISAGFYAIERGQVAVIDRVHLLQPFEDGIDRVPVPTKNFGLELGMDLVARLRSEACRLAQRRDAHIRWRALFEPFDKAQDRPGELVHPPASLHFNKARRGVNGFGSFCETKGPRLPGRNPATWNITLSQKEGFYDVCPYSSSRLGRKRNGP